MSTTVEEKIAAARHLLIQVEAQHTQSVALARKALGELEEDVRELRREAIRRDVKFYTESELARIVRVGVKAIRRLRKEGKLVPCSVGQPIRYSSEHVLQLARIPEAPPARKRGKYPQEVKGAKAS